MALNENRFFKPEQMTTQAAFDGLPAQVVILTNRFGMSISIMDIGATWLSCIVPVNGYRRDVLLGSADMKAHQQQTAYFGATVGRFANRIA
nr:galactose-1-epimerase [Proteus mirabilis]MCD4637966.1 galactose-1-epimerase [Proteus mirabilis]